MLGPSKRHVCRFRMNKLSTLPRGFGAFPSLEILDLTYNNLSENSLPENFFNLITLRALYLSDNDFEQLPGSIGRLVNLEIVSLSSEISLFIRSLLYVTTTSLCCQLKLDD